MPRQKGKKVDESTSKLKKSASQNKDFIAPKSIQEILDEETVIPRQNITPLDIEEIKRLLRYNVEYTKKVHNVVMDIKRSFFWMQVRSFFKVMLVVGPLIIAYVYFMPYIKNFINQYREILENISKIIH